MSPAEGADGKITVKPMDGGNRRVVVEFQHLPPPSRLRQGYSEYVVWFLPRDRPAQMAGLLAYNQDKRSGMLSTTTPFAVFSVVVTLEADQRPTTPSYITIARREIASPK
jgi:hypothetical protein